MGASSRPGLLHLNGRHQHRHATIGGALGASVGASLLTASLGPAGYPSPRAYTTAVLVYAAALAGAAVIASRLPPAGARVAAMVETSRSLSAPAVHDRQR